MTEQGFERAGLLAELPDGAPLGVRLESGERVCLIRVNEAVFAVADQCPHADFPLCDGEMVDDYVIECALHGAQFDVRTGRVLEAPATDDLGLYEVRVQDGEVWVRTPS
jgi:3-phenylpropionate/trans-cinnamate dioxygenase ferredoxin subunit